MYNDDFYSEPEIDDSVKFCPECETPNQFGETCPRCLREMELEGSGPFSNSGRYPIEVSVKKEVIEAQKKVWGDVPQLCAGHCTKEAAAGSCYCPECEDKFYE